MNEEHSSEHAQEPTHVAAGVGPVSCARCGYSLEGLPDTGSCPECGTPVEFSLRGNRLEFSDRTYVGTLAKGLRWVTVGILVAIVMGLGNALIIGVLVANSPNLMQTAAVLVVGINILVGLAILWGWWQFSEQDPRYTGREDGSAARKALRVFLVIALGMQIGSAVWDLFIPATGAAVWVSLAVGLLALVAWVIRFFVTMNYLMWVLTRIPDWDEHKRAARFRWLGPVIFIVGAPLLMLGPLITLVMYWNMLDRTRKRIKAIHAGMQA